MEFFKRLNLLKNIITYLPCHSWDELLIISGIVSKNLTPNLAGPVLIVTTTVG